MAQEAYCSIRQWLVMKEDDITTKTLKRFRQYILDREKPQQDTARPAATATSSTPHTATATSSKQRFPVRKTPRQDVVPPAATATSSSSGSKGDDSWMDDALLVEALTNFERLGDAGGKQRGLEEGQPGTQKLRTIAPAAAPASAPGLERTSDVTVADVTLQPCQAALLEVIIEGWHKMWESAAHGLPQADLKWLKEDGDVRGLFQRATSYQDKHGDQ